MIGHVGVQPVRLDELDVEIALEVLRADEGCRLGDARAEGGCRPRTVEHAILTAQEANTGSAGLQVGGSQV